MEKMTNEDEWKLNMRLGKNKIKMQTVLWAGNVGYERIKLSLW